MSGSLWPGEYLSEFARSDEYKEMLVQHTVDMICNSGGNVGIERISQELVYSPRYVERVFKEYTGFSPKRCAAWCGHTKLC